jgi:hypothetical protein
MTTERCIEGRRCQSGPPSDASVFMRGLLGQGRRIPAAKGWQLSLDSSCDNVFRLVSARASRLISGKVRLWEKCRWIVAASLAEDVRCNVVNGTR